MSRLIHTFLRFVLSHKFIEIFTRVCLFVFHIQIGLFIGNILKNTENIMFNEIIFVFLSIALTVFLIYKMHYINILKFKNLSKIKITIWILIINISPFFSGVLLGLFSDGTM